MWSLSLPWWEFVLRGAIVYVFLLVILRVTGKRNTGQLAPFDLVLLLVLSDNNRPMLSNGSFTTRLPWERMAGSAREPRRVRPGSA